MERMIEEINIRTLDFEKSFVALQKLASPLQLGKKMRVIVEYDPQKQSTTFQYFSVEE